MSLVLGFSFWLTFRAQFHVEAHKSDRSYSLKFDLGGKKRAGGRFGRKFWIASGVNFGSFGA